MKKKVSVGVVTSLSLIFIIFCIGLWVFINYHPQPLKKRLISIQSNMLKAQGDSDKCFSDIDCELVILPREKCIPTTWIQAYSKRAADIERFKELEGQYLKVYKKVYGNKNNRQCINDYQPKIKCVTGSCVVKLKGGRLLKY